MPARVRAWCALGKHHDIEVEDEVNAYFEYENGATGLFTTSTAEAPGTNRLEIAGSRGKLVCENETLTFIRNETDASEFLRTTDDRFGCPSVWNIEIPVPTPPLEHAKITRNFVNAILDGEPLVVPAREGLASVELANAMLLSSLEGRMVELPLDGPAYQAKLEQLVAESKFVKKEVRPTSLTLDGSNP